MRAKTNRHGVCPICRRPPPEGAEAMRFRPFCSRRCADIDLHRWLTGAYRVDGEQASGEEGRGHGAAPET